MRKEHVKVQARFGGLEPIKQYAGPYSISFTSGTPSGKGTVTRVSINDIEISESPIISGVSSSEVTSPSKYVVYPTFHEVSRPSSLQVFSVNEVGDRLRQCYGQVLASGDGAVSSWVI